MKIKGLRWVIIGMIMLIVIINYLDRGTLNYMWVTNVEYQVVDTPNTADNCAVATDGFYVLTKSSGKTLTVAADAVTPKMVGDREYVINKEGMAYDLGIISYDMTAEDAAKRAKDLLGTITIFFMIAYGISQLFSGKIYDKIGTRKGFFFSVLLWGAADALTSLARGIVSLTGFRMMLGLGEAGPWPGATKSNAEWFPQKERAFAQGLFGAAASIGSVLAPIIILMLYIAVDWKLTFIIVGCLGLVWLLPWMVINKKGPKEHPWITDQEREYIVSGQPESKHADDGKAGQSWGQLLRNKKNWSVILGRFFLDPIWWMFVTYLPLYLTDVFNMNIKDIAFSAWVPYFGAMIGSIVGGWFSGWLIKRGHTVNYARKCAILVGGAIIIPSIILAVLTPNPIFAIIMMAFVLGGFQFMITNIQTLPSDLHSGKSVGSLAGLGGASAVLGTILAILFAQYITNWAVLFGLLGALVPLSALSVFLTVGKIEHIDK